MLIKLLGKRAQTTAEYAILFGLVVGALLAMQLYIRRGVQARLKDVVDHGGLGGVVGNSELIFSTGQYEPYYLTSNAISTQNVTDKETVNQGGSVDKSSYGKTAANRDTTVGWSPQEEQE
jgi:hypothetical protein